jgi:hypothetical protein
VAPQLDGVGIVGNLVDDRAEDGGSIAVIENDGRHAEAAGALAQLAMLDGNLFGGLFIAPSRVEQVGLQAGVDERTGDHAGIVERFAALVDSETNRGVERADAPLAGNLADQDSGAQRPGGARKGGGELLRFLARVL